MAGNETTRNLINHSMLALIDHPDQAQRLRDDPSLWDTAVDEMLRWGSSIHNFRRTATRDTELRGVPIKEGDKVVIYYASANRDEDVFDDPAHLRRGPHAQRPRHLRRRRRALLPRRQPRPGRDQGDHAPDRRAPARPRASPARYHRLHSDFVNGIKTMPVRFTPTPRLSEED